LTLIGDAAHVMSPFAGEGANIAVLDGAKLAEAISDVLDHDPTDDRLDKSIESFEQKMFERANAAAAESDRNMRQLLGDEEDIETVIAKWERMVRGDAPQ
jgi:2-polyprenyl-6-methoxyphenol hydroxylase-like FAD-dependent oxidoreductase